MTELVLQPSSPVGGKCTICQYELLADETTTRCDSCQVVYHSDCWRHNDGCGTYGCRRAPATRKVSYSGGDQPSNEPGAWGDTKSCPNCGEYLVASAMECPRCRATFDTRAPMTSHDYGEQQRRRASLRRATGWAIVLFVASGFGVAAPLTLAWGVAWFFSRRTDTRRPAGIAELLLHGSIALSTAYVFLMILIFGLGW